MKQTVFVVLFPILMSAAYVAGCSNAPATSDAGSALASGGDGGSNTTSGSSSSSSSGTPVPSGGGGGGW
jgi:hypothetical protein